MEHPCHRCHAAVGDSSPFCPNCGAPQIRVPAREEALEAPAGLPESGPGPGLTAATPFLPAAVRPNRRIAIRSAATAGGLVAVLGFIPLGRAFVLVLPLVGFLTILLYRRRSLEPDLSAAMGFQLGALGGLFGSAIFGVLTALETLLFQAGNQLRDAMIQAIRQAQARAADPQARQMLDYFLTPRGLVVMMVLGFLFTAIMFVLLSGIGGAIFAVLLRRKNPPA